MKILSIHADRISYDAKMRTKIAEPTDIRKDLMEQCMVFFSCVEKGDELNPQKIIAGATQKVIDRLGQVKVNDLMIFPYAHLSLALSSPDVALQILKGLESALIEKGYNVKRAPFGWYKEFKIKTKCHPMAELSLSISPCDSEPGDILCPYCSNPIKSQSYGISAPTRSIQR